ncbi:MAG: rhomboid family intramembrane serine protease [candidate division KSB1 bacterium]|nr:rhomboid family intramembrane serine protease [candidate division KSB1 bacterium]
MLIKRKKTGSIVCPACGKLVSVNADKCWNCGRRRPGLWGFAPVVQNLLGGFVPVVTLICIVLYVVSLLLDPSTIFRSRGLFSFLSPSLRSLYVLGMTGTEVMKYGRWWTLITAIYLHGGLLHILFNLLWIRQLGPIVEEFYGSSRLILIFTISGITGFILSNLMGISFTIGASGSIFGLLGALVYYGRTRGGAFGAAVYRQMVGWAIFLFIMGFMMPGVNNFAHGGGFVGGYLAALFLGFQESKAETFLHKLLALGAVILTGIGFLLSVWTVIA